MLLTSENIRPEAGAESEVVLESIDLERIKDAEILTIMMRATIN